MLQSTDSKPDLGQIITSLDEKFIPRPKQLCQQLILVENKQLHISCQNQNLNFSLKRLIHLQNYVTTKVLNKRLLAPKVSYANVLERHLAPNISFPLFIDLSKENSPRSPCRTYHTKQRNLQFAHVNPL